MVRLRKKDVIILICALILIACAMFIRYMGRTSDSVPEQVSLVRSAIYIGLISAWGISVRKRIIQLQVLYALKDFLIKRLGSLLEHTT